MHKGHVYCIDVAANVCDHVVVIMFINGEDELKVLQSNTQDETLSVKSRIERAKRVCDLYDNVEFRVVDCVNCKLPDGSEDWDAETPLVRQYVPHMDYVFSSEPRYEDYFARAYPEATHVVVDAERKRYPISSTMIRAMSLLEDKNRWMV